MKKSQYEASIAHLKKQRGLEGIELTKRKPPFSRPSDPFASLTRSIIYQQLSGKAAATILARLLALFPQPEETADLTKMRYPTPKEMLTLTDAQFRSVGISSQKVTYLRDLANRFLDGTIDPTNFKNMSDDEIRDHLLVVKGIGRWTADMFLMFTLYRPDVLPTGDLAIQKGFQEVFKLRTRPDANKMEKLAKAWEPHRTVACWYLWELMDGE